MLSGESGTGKEMFANNIHSLSVRTGKFVAINCASIPGELLESVLFGHEKGAFIGANKRTIGKVELAQGGTLFLDEMATCLTISRQKCSDFFRSAWLNASVEVSRYLLT